MDTHARKEEPLFIRLCSRDMREAFLEHRSFKSQGPEMEELASYVRSNECEEDLRKLAQGVYDFPPARQVMLRKAHSERRRIIYIYPPRQNMLLKYLVWGMQEYDDIFSDSLYSFRRDLNVADLFHKVLIRKNVHELYAVKADVHDYGYSIRPELLKPMLHDIMAERDPALLSFLEYLLDRNEFVRGDKVVHASMGGLPGVPVGCFFNNVYLMGLDSAMDARTTLYSRYADDICAFVSSAEEAEEVLAQIREQVAKMGVTLNEEKTQIVEPGGSVELLGIQIRGTELDVADNTLSKAKGKLTHYAKKLIRWERYGKIAKDEAAARMARRINHYFYGDGTTEHQLSWREFFFRVITRPDSLHELDLVCQDLLRKVATGKLGNARYRCRYDDLRALGYRPLVHEYYRYRKEHGII